MNFIISKSQCAFCDEYNFLNAVGFVNYTNPCIRSTKGHSCLNNGPDFGLGIEGFQRLQIGRPIISSDDVQKAIMSDDPRVASTKVHVRHLGPFISVRTEIKWFM